MTTYDTLYASLMILVGIFGAVFVGLLTAVLSSRLRDDDNEQSRENQSWVYAFERFTECLDLSYNWDGEGARPPSLAAMTTAKIVAYALQAHNVIGPDRVVPTLNGGLQMEWFTEKEYIEVEILSDGLYPEWMIETDGKYVHLPPDYS